MHPQRRLRLLLIAVLLILVFILFLTADGRRTRSQRFYQQTVEAMDNKAAARRQEQQDSEDDGSLFKKLKPGVGEEYVVAPERQPPPPKVLDTDAAGVTDGADVPDARDPAVPGTEEKEIPIAGRKKMPQQQSEPEPDAVELEVKEEMNAILKRSPIIVFSKTYCPFSRKAKNILLERYNIVPAPFVVELDQHSMGQKLQEAIAGITGRKTVPNVLVSGRSIGGGDEIEELDTSGELSSKIKDLAGKRVTEVSLKKVEKPL